MNFTLRLDICYLEAVSCLQVLQLRHCMSATRYTKILNAFLLNLVLAVGDIEEILFYTTKFILHLYLYICKYIYIYIHLYMCVSQPPVQWVPGLSRE